MTITAAAAHARGVARTSPQRIITAEISSSAIVGNIVDRQSNSGNRETERARFAPPGAGSVLIQRIHGNAQTNSPLPSMTIWLKSMPHKAKPRAAGFEA